MQGALLQLDWQAVGATAELTNLSISSRGRPQQSTTRKLVRKNAFAMESDHSVQHSGASASATTSSTTTCDDDGDDWIVVEN